MTLKLGKHRARGTYWAISAKWRPRPVAGTYLKATDGLLPDPAQRSPIAGRSISSVGRSHEAIETTRTGSPAR